MQEILDKPLHTLTMSQIRLVRQVADCAFVRLVQPFKQVRVVKEFDYRATVRSAMRTGHMLPTYTRHEKTHPKSHVLRHCDEYERN